MKAHQKNSERLVTKVFKDVSEKYDLMNDIMSLGIHRIWKRDFINLLNPQKNTKLIDVASGTGDIAKLFLKQVNYDATVYCIDENRDMLEINKKKLKNKKSVKWFCNNAEELPFKDNEFDYYTISFGIRNIENIDNALKEAFRVLKPGGRLLCLEFSKVENEILNSFYKIYSKTLPFMGKIVTGNSEAYEYLINSIDEFYTQKEFLALLKKKCFTNVTYKNLSGGIAAIHSAWKI